MTAIGDSSAVRIEGRVLAQHQAALTLLQAKLSMPSVVGVSWLDLACGRGQILGGLEENLSAAARGKIDYWAYDVNQDYVLQTKRVAENLGLASIEVKVGDLHDFDRILPAEVRFDFITLTNTFHEVNPSNLAMLLANAISRLSSNGVLFVYDMEQIVPPELGALPWSGNDARSIVHSLLDALGAEAYRPEVSRWSHATVRGWNFQLSREHLAVDDEMLRERSPDAIQAATEMITSLMGKRLDECRASLQTFTDHGAQTAEEEADREHLLYEYWALSRSLESRA